MNNKTTGYTLGLAAMGMMLGLMSADIKEISSWSEVFSPVFVAAMFGHISVVVMAFIGGKLIPTEPQPQRAIDPTPPQP